MNDKIIISSDNIDKHGDLMSKEALESGAKTINGEKCVKWTIEHKRDIPPLGKIIDGEVIEKNGHYFLTARTIKYDSYEEVLWDNNLVKASFTTNKKPFNEPVLDTLEKLKIEVDPNNFRSYESFLEYKLSLKKINPEIDTGEYLRKALINDPEIILYLTGDYLLYRLIKPTLDKTAEKISERISDKLANEADIFYEFIRRSIKELFFRLKSTSRPISYVIKVPGKPEIELFARIRDSEELIKSLKPSKIENIKNEIFDLAKHFEIDKAQFILYKGKWKFNYLLTSQGDAIGTKFSFKKRDRMLEIVNEKAMGKGKLD